MTLVNKEAREERQRVQAEGVRVLEASGAVDDLYARIDAGKVEGRDGLIQQLVKAGLERGSSRTRVTGRIRKWWGPQSGTWSWRFPGTGTARSPRCWS